MAKIFITSDPHFNHANIIRFCNRPFVDTEEMNKSLIASWNNLITDEDVVYILGDFSLGSSKSALYILEQLNGKKYLITGNHEKSVLSNDNCRKHFEWIKDYFELKYDNKYFMLFHYAMRVWNKSHHGSIHLYGHSHDGLDKDNEYNGLSMDVGMDSAYRIFGEYRPFNIEEIIEIMNKRKEIK